MTTPSSKHSDQSHATDSPASGGRLQPLRAAHSHCTALRHELFQADALATIVQSRSHGKAEEPAQLRTLLTKSRDNLARLERDLAEMHSERQRMVEELR